MIRLYPLIKHQFKNMKLLMLLLPASLVLYILSFTAVMKHLYINNIFDMAYNRYGNIYYSSIDFGYILFLCVFWTIIICAAQSWYEKKSSVANFISCLPYKRVTVLNVRILTTVCFYTACIILIGIALLATREAYFNLYISRLYDTTPNGEIFAFHDTSFMIIKALFAVWLGTTIFYLSATLFQMIVSNVFIAIAIGFAAPFFPSFFVHFFNNLLYNSFGIEFDFLSYLASKLLVLTNMFVNTVSYSISYTSGMEHSVPLQTFNGMFPILVSKYSIAVLVPTGNVYMIVLALCAAVLFAVCLFVYSKLVCYANYSDLIAFRKASAVFAVLGALCCALLTSNFFKSAVTIFFVFAITFVISYLAFSKIAGRGDVLRDKKTIWK